MNPILSSSVSVIKINENILEFFKSNTRQQVRIKINEGIIVDIISSRWNKIYRGDI